MLAFFFFWYIGAVAVELMQKGLGVHGSEMKEAVQDWLDRNRKRVS